MITLEEILNDYSNYQTRLQDRLGSRLCQFLTEEQAAKIGFGIDYEKYPNEKWKEPIPFTRENVLEQLKQDVAFGFKKALDKRGLSAGMMFEVVLAWNKILQEGLEDWDENNYAMYGLPLFKATAVKYGWDNPIGDDSGSEEYYNEYYDEYDE